MQRLLIIIVLFCAFTLSSTAQEKEVYIIKESHALLRAHSAGALSFIWFLNGQPVNGEHNEKLLTSQAGTYTVIGLNDCCESVLSDPVEITFGTGPEIDTIDIAMSKTVDSRAVFLNDDFEYQIYIYNHSAHTAKKVKVQEVLSNSIIYQQVALGHLGTVNYDQKSHVLVWKFDELVAGRTEELRIRVKAKETGWVETTAKVESETLDIDLSNNTALMRKEIYVLKIPNTFTPNGDGLNDFFVVNGHDPYSENELIIFNRYGTQVYQSENYTNDWAGDNLDEGTYYYVFRVKMENNWRTFKGYITLIRNTK